MSEQMLIASFYFLSIISFACCVKIGHVYVKNQNPLSLIMILSFIASGILGYFWPLALYINKEQYYLIVRIFLLFYIAGLAATVFYIIDIKQLVIIPLVITIIIAFQAFISIDGFLTNAKIYQYTLGMIPIIGFFYLAFKNRDGKSLGMAIHFILITMGGITLQRDVLSSAILYFVAGLIQALSIFGALDGMFKKKNKKKVSWIEKKLSEKVK